MKIKTFASIALFLGFIATSSVAQSSGPNFNELANSFESDAPYGLQNSELDSLIAWQERILLHIDKPVVDEGAPLFFKAYTLTGPNRIRATLSKVLKLELVNASKDVLAVQYHKIENGTSGGAFVIPKKIGDGIYTLRAYTRWMQNYGESYYSTTALVIGDASKISESVERNDETLKVSFYPEGGNLISNFNNRLLIKASTGNTNPMNLSGDIIDGKGNKIMPIVSYGNGTMSAIFRPKAGEDYQLKTKDGDLFDLPKVQTKGHMLNVNNLREDALSIRVQASPESLGEVIYLKGSMGGVTYFSKELDMEDTVMDLEISKKGIPFGEMQISLEDENGNELSIRPIFIDADKALNLTILPLNEERGDDELAFIINVTDSSGKPIETEVSLSAINIVEDNNSNLISAIDGFSWERDDLGLADGNSTRINRFIRDLELLTKVGDDASAFPNLPNEIKYPFQKGLDLFGYAYNLNNKLLKNTKIQMLSATNNNVVIKEVETDGSGRVRMENLQMVGENELVFRTEGDNSKSRIVKLVPIQESLDKNRKAKLILAKGKQGNKNVIQTSPWEPNNSNDLIELDEVVVLEDKLEQKKTLPSVYNGKPNRVRFQDIKSPKTIPQLFLGIPGVQVTGLGTLEPRVSLPRAAGAGPVLWVLDGLPLLQPTSLVDIINSVNGVDVERIEILYGAQASIYGTRAAGGAILIYTRSGAGLDYVKRKEGRLKFEGYHDSPSFDKYSEQLSKRPKRYQSKANTLFWNPNIKTNEKGEAIVRFTVPIAYDQLEIKASAITEEGKMASVKTSF